MSSTGVTSTVKAAIQGGKGHGVQIVQIIKLPQSLENSAKAIRLEGKITSQGKEGDTVRIETEKGTVEVKVKGNRQPQVGQKIEIEIPAGRQPRQATIRVESTPQNVNTQTQTPSTQNAPNLATRITTPSPQPSQTQAQSQNTALSTQQNTNSRTAPPLPPALQETLLSTQNTGTITHPTRTITPEALLRLLSVPPAQAQTIAKDFVATLPQPITNIIDKTVFRALITAQHIATQTISQNPVLQIPVTTQKQSITPLNQTTQNVPQPILNNNFIGQTPTALQTTPQQITLQQTTYLKPTALNTAQPLLQNQTLPLTTANTIIPTQISPVPATSIAPITNAPQTATLLPVTFDPSNPTQHNTQRLGQIDIHIVKVTPPNATLSAPTMTGLPPPSPIPAATKFTSPLISVNTAPSLSAQVTGFTPQGLPLVTIQGITGGLPQSFILQQAGTNLQLGSQLQIIPKNGIPIAGQLSPVATQTLNNPLLQGFQWPALDELYNTLLKINPQAATSLSRTLPNAGNPAQMGAAAMTFIAAVKSGNLENWLGDKKIDLLQQAGRRNILSRLTQDTTRTAAPEQSTSSEWRAVPMPMFWESEIHRIMLYTRHENQHNEQDNKDGSGQTRFIFDLNLTRMGDVQIDGLIKDKRLDLVIRTQNAFSEPMMQTMRRAYTGALDQAELSGDLNFQGSTKNWVHVLQNQEQIGVDV